MSCSAAWARLTREVDLLLLSRYLRGRLDLASRNLSRYIIFLEGGSIGGMIILFLPEDPGRGSCNRLIF